MSNSNLIDRLPIIFDSFVLVLDENNVSGIVYLESQDYFSGRMKLSVALKMLNYKSIIIDHSGNCIERVGIRISDDARTKFHKLTFFIFDPLVNVTYEYDYSTYKVIDTSEIRECLVRHLDNYKITIYENPDVYERLMKIVHGPLPVLSIMKIIHAYENDDISLEYILIDE